MNHLTLSLRLLIMGMILCGGVECAVSAAPNTPEGKTLVASEKPVQIASGGKAVVPIVISPKSSEELKKTAADLAASLKQITGAVFIIEQGTEAKGITLGTAEQFPDDKLKEALAIKDVYDGVEAFAIRSDGDRIRLLANTDLGASHVAYRFLELLGCRWYFFGKTWEVIPEIPSLSFDLNESSRPQILSRAYGFPRVNKIGEEGDPLLATVAEKWIAANRMGESLDVKVGHAWQSIPTAFKKNGYPFKKEFEEHPEYYALVDGKRTPPQFCVSNPGLQKIILHYVNKYFELEPSRDMVSLDTADQPGWCTCAECVKLGHSSVQPFYLANLAAKELQKTHPGKMVGLLAYSWHCDPPGFNMEPNVFVNLTRGMNASKYTFDQLFAEWSKRCTSMGIYEYFSYYTMDRLRLPGKGPHNKLNDLNVRMKDYVDHHVIGICGDALLSWGVHGLGYYLYNKIMWDTNADIKALKKDFYDKAFGPAAPAMERYYERLNLSSKPLKGVSLLRQCIDDLEEALVLAKSRPDVLARIDDLRAYMVYNYMGEKTDEVAANEVEMKKKALEMFTWCYRTRNNFMLDWLTFRARWGNFEAKGTEAGQFKVKEPTWYYKTTKDNPWKNNQPVTSQELDERFKNIKAEWGEVPVFTEQKYSDQVVLVQSDRKGEAEKKRTFVATATQLMASQKGEPLRFKVIVSPSPQLERPDAPYSLKALDGKEITTGSLPEGESVVDLKVPAAGIYSFTCKRAGAGWSIEFPDELHSALIVPQEVEFRPLIMAVYFYVPKKTSQIVMHVEEGSVFVRDPKNQVIHKGVANGKIVVIPVGNGMDGKVWSLSGRPRNLHFLNIPTVLSASPEMIFVPKEVAEKDALKIVLQ